ncbi:MAG: hypothetical protein B6D70_00820 [gamma proteobacterium symbiont of Stewartia floridana]|nr:MAG: hypothetical protein B6D76_17625 [gamma proteobacterium symbiont of Stewartia floridana]RLW57799.1 MAG: hypothetical protein B6D75_16035 [gamma proteobacterium symbiont of Stewartia floridana]RLW63381.1 MAG: hypothetical protein B6D73_15535 [gamma proteobacterium symbiont of Stewartia floridana]RLW67805.1 MAG: hypothetical protein B6D70_00820 [gamma proteobacterium symbiont of Stewartia floridana]
MDLTDLYLSDRKIAKELNTNRTVQILITHRLSPLLYANRNPAVIFMGSALGFVAKHNVPV